MWSEVDFHVEAVYAPALTIITEGVLTIVANCFLVRILNLVSILGLIWTIWIHLAWVRDTQGDSIVATIWIDIAYVL